MKRTVIAFLVAPLVPAAVFVHDAGPTFALVWSYVCTYVFGIPVFLILRKKRKESHIRYTTLGSVCGAAYIFAINYAEPVGVLDLALIFALVGAATAFCFSILRGHERKRA
jgi:hypothetical protein